MLCFLSKQGLSQDPAFYTIGEIELANIDVYTLLYDENTDILYIGSNSGIYVYKQNRFISIKSHKEQIGSSFFNLKQNDKGAIFCSNMSGQIFQIIDNSLELIYSPQPSFGRYYSFDIYEGTQLIVSYNRGVLTVDEAGNIHTLFDSKKPIVIEGDTLAVYLRFCQFKNSSVLYTGNTNTNKNYEYVVFFDNNHKISRYIKSSKGQSQFNKFIKQKEGVFGVRTDGSLQGFDQQLYQSFDKQEKERIYSIDENTTLGLNSQKGLRFIYLKNDTLTSSPVMFKNLFISAHAKLGENGMLYGTFGEGIRVVPNMKTKKNYHDELFLGIAASKDNEAALSCRSGEIYQVKNDELVLVDRAPHNVDNIYYVKNNQVAKHFGYGEFVYNDSRKRLTEANDIIAINNHAVFIGANSYLGAFFLNKESLKGLSIKRLPKSNLANVASTDRINSLVWDATDSTFYFAGKSGLFKLRWNSSAPPIKCLFESNQPIHDLFLIGDLLYCSTQKEGVIALNIRSGEKVFQLNTSKGLKSNHVKQAELSKEFLYMVTSNGLQVYNTATKKFVQLGLNEGVEPEKITKFALSADKLWLLEKHACSSIDLDKINYSKVNQISSLFIDSILVNKELIDFSNTTEFDYQQNALVIYFDYRDLLTKKETRLLYTLEGFYSEWKTIETSQNKIEFQSLPVGSYVFKIKAKYRDYTTKTFVYRFKILPPFWQRWWFYVLIGVFAAGTIAVIAVYRMQRLRKKNREESLKREMEKDAIDAQLKAIKTQMNPHFIFNSINSIQDLVLQKETLKSYDYLVIFSKMVRTILDFSEREFIPLEEELAFLNTYLGLEKLRFKDEFKYEVTSDIQSKTIQIPSLIVQPFIENAIKHGLLHKDGKKRLTVSFTASENNIICVVSDNGIGLSESKKINARQSGGHKSFSTKAIEKRLSLLQNQTNVKAGYEIENLVNEKGEVIGTKAIITLPTKY